MLKMLPNILSFIRLLLCPVFVWVFFHSQHFMAFLIFLAASLLDVADGVLARKFDAVTDLGKLLDPLADKLLQLSAFICFTITGDIPLFLALVFAAKELTMLLGGFIFLKSNRCVVCSNTWGKAAAFTLSATLCAMFFTDSFLQPLSTPIHLFLYVAVGFSVFAMVQYGISYVFHRKTAD